jgi:6-pyruvoyltetrahydropterin/6-carboxytetrahydropterin synthase
MYQSTKTYDHNLGFSCAFRQWTASHSHCSLIHGYALSFKFVFEAPTLDRRNWVVDFGDLDELKDQLKFFFDHTLLVDESDPELDTLLLLQQKGIAKLRVLEGGAGCEAFARFAYRIAADVVKKKFPHARVISCEVREHGANSALYIPNEPKLGER